MKKLLLLFLAGAVVVTLLRTVIEYQTRLSEKKMDSLAIEDSNLFRKRYGVPVIEASWILHESDSNKLYWAAKDDRVTTLEPFHLYKKIFLKHGNPLIEEDDFHFEGHDSVAYRLTMRHKYLESGGIVRDVDELITYFRGRYPPAIRIEITSQKADSILDHWRIKIPTN